MTSSYRLPHGLFDLDDAAAQQYAADTGTELIVSAEVNVSPGQVLDAWIKHIWLVDAVVVAPGEGRGRVNETRVITSLGIEEQIVSAGVPSDFETGGAVPSILYRINKPGAFPIARKLALVRFVPVGASQTQIVWGFKLTATTADKTPALVAVVEKRVSDGLARFARGLNDAASAKL